MGTVKVYTGDRPREFQTECVVLKSSGTVVFDSERYGKVIVVSGMVTVGSGVEVKEEI